jgi:cell division protease FtsH
LGRYLKIQGAISMARLIFLLQVHINCIIINTMKLFSKNIITAVLIFFILVGFYFLLGDQSRKVKEVSLSELVSQINRGEVSKIVVKGQNLEITLKEGGEEKSKKEQESALSESLLNYNVSQEELAKVIVDIREPSGVLIWLGAILPFLVPFLLIVLFFWLISRQVKSTSFQAFSFGKSKARVIMPDDRKEKVTFEDVAGVEEAKEELKEVVDFLKNPKKFLDIGAKIPKGVLLMGAPGSGKTLLARAVAGQAGVPFFYLSASEFIELFVGVGASRVRSLFQDAKKAAPSIIFVDEIDAVGRHRGTGLGGGHDEREQTLNQILVEMDGFEPHEKVIVMAATNRPDVLDPALLRPGRFDRRIVLDLPDINAREAILKIHSRKKLISKEVNFRRIAERTPGFSGADLENLVNEAAILAARENRKKVEQTDLIRSIDKVLLGPERKSHLLTQEEKKISAYHEAGHSLAAAGLPNTDPVHKVSIVSRGRAAGYTLKLPIEDKHLYSKSHFLSELAVALGGFVSEKLVFGDITTGASDDLKKATAIARNLVTKYGMSEKVGPVFLGDNEETIFLGKELTTEKHYSEDLAKVVDSEVSRFIEDAFKTAQGILTKHRSILDAIAIRLIEKETIERDEFKELVNSLGLKYDPK